MSRRSIAIGLAVVAPLFAPSTVLRAQTFGGSYDYDCEGEGISPVSGNLGSVAAREDYTLSGEGTTLTGAGCLPGVASRSSVLIDRFAFPGRLRTECNVHGEQYTPAPCGNSAGGKARLGQRMDATDLVFRRISNPAATGNVLVALNVEFSALAPQPFSCGSGQSEYTLCAGVGTSPCKLLGKRTWNGSNSFGSIGTYANDGSVVVLSSGTVGVPLLTPTTLHLEHNVNITALLCESTNPTSTSLSAWAQVSLPTGGPVFNLPPDITVDSVQLGIVNNQWVPSRALFTTAFPNPVIAGNEFNLVSWNGDTGQPGVFVLVSVNGIPVSAQLGPVGFYDLGGEFRLSSIPTVVEWSGVSLGVLSATINSSGRLVISPPIVAVIQ